MTYTTQELIDFLEYELCATAKGERISFSSEEKLDNPVVSKAIDMYKVGRVFVYRDYRRQIHQYQRNNHVSGIVWRTVTFQGQSIRFPELHNQLIEIEGDKQILMDAKQSVLDFWHHKTTDMRFYLSGNPHQEVSQSYLQLLYEEAEWAEIDGGKDELYLGLCWGNPQEYIYKWANPDSGCHRIIATKDKPSSISI